MELVRWLRLSWDRAAAWACVVAGAVTLVLGWVGVSDKLYTAEQIPYVLSDGLGAMFLLGLGGILWLSADLRDEWTQLDKIEELLAQQGATASAGTPATSPGPSRNGTHLIGSPQ